ALNGLQGKKKRADLTIADYSSTLASIVTSNLCDIAKGQHQSFIRTLLQKITAKALDASTPPSSSGEDTFVPTLHYPEYERHVVQEYADVYFEEFEKRYLFIPINEFHSWMNALLSRKLADDSPAVPLVDAILTIGYRLTQKHNADDPNLAGKGAQQYRAVGLKPRCQLIGVQASILTIQALVAMTISFQGSHASAEPLSFISVAVQHCLTLKLNRITGIRNLAKSEDEYQLLQLIFWVVYLLEKPLAMRLGRSSSIDDDFIDYSPRMIQHQSDRRPFIFLCEHAKLCSIVIKQLYGLAKSKERRDEMKGTIDSLDKLLQAWKDSWLKQQESNQIKSGSQDFMASASLCEQKAEICLKYHELKVTIHHKSEDFRDNMAFLGMASGWFSRLATTTSYNIAYNELTQLIALAQQQCVQ
ncbi:MAG: hypothetical protein Q9187_008025, partial [Circinaria calcarea]